MCDAAEMGDTERTPRLGDWVCTEHGPMTPYTGGVVPACPECLEPALEAVIGKGGALVLRMPHPDFCDGPERHPLTAGQVTVGWTPCLCQGGQGHTNWRCQRCPSVLMWPPHDLVNRPSRHRPVWPSSG